MTQTERAPEAGIEAPKSGVPAAARQMQGVNKAFDDFFAQTSSTAKSAEAASAPEVIDASSVDKALASDAPIFIEDYSPNLPPFPAIFDETIEPGPAVIAPAIPETPKSALAKPPEESFFSPDVLGAPAPVRGFSEPAKPIPTTPKVEKPALPDQREQRLREMREATERQNAHLAELFARAHNMLAPTWENSANSIADRLEAVNAFLRLNKEKLHEQTPEGAAAFFTRIGKPELAAQVKQAAELAVVLANQPAKADLEKAAPVEQVKAADSTQNSLAKNREAILVRESDVLSSSKNLQNLFKVIRETATPLDVDTRASISKEFDARHRAIAGAVSAYRERADQLATALSGGPSDKLLDEQRMVKERIAELNTLYDETVDGTIARELRPKTPEVKAPVVESAPLVRQEAVVSEPEQEPVISAGEAAVTTQEISKISKELAAPVAPAKIPWYKKLFGLGKPKAPASEKNPLKIPAWKEVSAKEVAARREHRPVVSAPVEQPTAAPKVETKQLTRKEVFRNDIIRTFKELQQSRIGPDGMPQKIGARTAYDKLVAIFDSNVDIKNITQTQGVEVFKELFDAETKPAPRILLAALLEDHGVDVGLGDEIAKFKALKEARNKTPDVPTSLAA